MYRLLHELTMGKQRLAVAGAPWGGGDRAQCADVGVNTG